MNSKRQVKGKLGHVGCKNSRLPAFDVNMKFNLSSNEKFVWLANTNFLRTVRVRKINQSETYTGPYLLDTSSWISFSAFFTAEDIFLASTLQAFV